MNDVTTRVLDELNIIPGTTDRPGLSRFDEARYFINAFCKRYISEDYEKVFAMTDAEQWEYWKTVDKRIFDFEFDTQEKAIIIPEIVDTSILDQTPVFTTAKPDPDFETIILEREGEVFPKLIAVSIPKAMDASLYQDSGMPFHIYFHPSLGQNTTAYYTATSMPERESLKSTVDQNFIPYGWDFLFYMIVKNITYRTGTNMDSSGRIDVWAGKGLLYQITNSSRNLVNVIPILDPTHNAGDFENPTALLQILQEIQQFVFNLRGLENQEASIVGATAISAFSSGHLSFNNLLRYAGDSTDTDTFFADTLQEVYMFDAPSGTNDQWVALANAWAQKYGEQKVVRGYSQWKPTNVSLLLGSAQQVEEGKVIVNSENDNRSFALLGAPFLRMRFPVGTGNPYIRLSRL